MTNGIPGLKNVLSGFLSVSCAVAAPGVASALQGAEDPVAFLERAAGEFSALDGFCADFQQTLTAPLLDQVTRSRGRMCQQQPDRFSMRFTDPQGDLIVADGEWLWIYFPSGDAGQVIRSAMTSGGPGRFDFHREFLSDPGSKYDPSYIGTEEMDGRRVHVIRLVPRQASAYREARVWIDEGLWLIRRAEIEEENGNLREVQLAQLERNPRFGSEDFRFTPPQGVQIITR
jgi:outer membrane lipoprotein carrier protein